MRSRLRLLAFLAIAGAAPADEPPRLGQPVDDEEIAAISLNVLPDGRGLPAGSGTASQGEPLYAAHCASCHGDQGAGGELIAMKGEPTRGIDWTVGSAYPYATSFFDYVRRGMPAFAPKTLTDDEVYAITAYFLFLNDAVEYTEVMDRNSLPKTKLPASDYISSLWEETEKDRE